ncbi:hypothetical protein DJ031_09655 [bacterium endosymbiont of Escarpia laminata]|nr:MAG: hypothetical protein DJ031_09655 [bacterium endosymbiont of Escarpia laminata]
MESEANSPKSGSTLLAILVRRKKIFALSLVILTLAGLPWALSTPRLHFYKATFMTGQTEINTASNRQDNSAQAVISLLEEVIIPEAKSGLAEQWPDINRMAINLRLTNNPRLITLETRIADSETKNAVKLYGVILEKLISQQSENYFAAQKRLQNQLQTRVAAQQQLQQSAVETIQLKKFLTQPLPSNTQLTTTNKSVNDNNEQLYQLLDLEYQVNQNLLNNSLMIIQLQDQLSTIKSPKIVMQPALSLQPAGPQRSLKFMIIFSLAFIGAAFLVFFLNSLSQTRSLLEQTEKRDLK